MDTNIIKEVILTDNNLISYIKNILNYMLSKDLNTIILSYFVEREFVTITKTKFALNLDEKISLHVNEYSLYLTVQHNKVLSLYTDTDNKLIKCYHIDENTFYSTKPMYIYWRTIQVLLSIYNKTFFFIGNPKCVWYAKNNCYCTDLFKDIPNAPVICEYSQDSIKCEYAVVFTEPDNFIRAIDIFQKTISLLQLTLESYA
jgi:hypothetical protein